MALKISEITTTLTDIVNETLVEVSEKTGASYTTKKFNLQNLLGGDTLNNLSDVTPPTASNQILIWNGTKWVPITYSLNNLSDVEAPTTTDKILAWNGTKWVPIDIPSGGTDGEGASALSELSDVSIATKADGDALVYVEADSKWKAVNLRKVNEVVKSSTATLTTAEVTGTIINDYGQDDDTTLTLPTAAKGLTFMVVLGTEVDNYFHIKPDTNDKIYLNGTAGADGEYVGVSSAKAGNTISFTSFQTGTDAYDWLAIPIAGDWSAES